MTYYIGGYFFFSSRRRHTRCSRDWSSDVCSSDLAEITESTLVAYVRHQLQQDPKPTHLRGGSSWTKPIRKTCTSCDSSLDLAQCISDESHEVQVFRMGVEHGEPSLRCVGLRYWWRLFSSLSAAGF